jgi:hypothetical protein
MSSPTASEPPPGENPALGHDSLTRLLQLGLRPGSRPVDELLDWLALDEGRAWFVTWSQASGRALLQSPPPALDALREFYGESKKLLARARIKEDRVGALAAYFLANAAALAHHGQLLSSRSRDELVPVLSDLAAALPEPWDDLVERAVERLGA